MLLIDFLVQSQGVGFSKTYTKAITQARQSQRHTAYINTLDTKVLKRQEIAKAARADGRTKTAEIMEGELPRLRKVKRFSSSSDAEDNLYSVASHEAGHAVFFQGKVEGQPIRKQWETILKRNKVSLLDRVAVSEYATADGGELFAELTSMEAQGRLKEVPANIRKSYRTVVDNWKPIR